MTVMTGCRSATPIAEPLSSIEILSPRATVLELPITVPSLPNLCGLSAIEVLTRFHGTCLSDDQRIRLKEAATPEGDIEVATVADVLRDCGFHVAVFAGSLDDSPTGLLHYVQARLPLVVLMASQSGSGHYVLVAGFDPDRGLMVVMDPLRGFLAYPSEMFRRDWERSGCATILAVPPTVAERDVGGFIARLVDVADDDSKEVSNAILSQSGGGLPLVAAVSLAPLSACPTLNSPALLGTTGSVDNHLTCPKCDFSWWGAEDSSCPKCGEQRVLHKTTWFWILLGLGAVFVVVTLGSAMSATAAAGV